MPTNIQPVQVGARTLPGVSVERFSGYATENGVWSDEAEHKYGQQGVDNVWMTDGKDVFVLSKRGIAAHFPEVGEGGTRGTVGGQSLRAMMVYDNPDTDAEKPKPGLDLFRGARPLAVAKGFFERMVDGIKALWAKLTA